jgi:hypothetical protein
MGRLMQTIGAVLTYAAVVTNARASDWPAELTAPGSNVRFRLRPMSGPGLCC